MDNGISDDIFTTNDVLQQATEQKPHASRPDTRKAVSQ